MATKSFVCDAQEWVADYHLKATIAMLDHQFGLHLSNNSQVHEKWLLNSVTKLVLNNVKNISRFDLYVIAILAIGLAAVISNCLHQFSGRSFSD